MKKYQSLVGSLQWAVSLGHWDVATTVMTMSKFRTEPNQGHLDHVKRIVAYISKKIHATIHFHIKPPDYLGISMPEYGWEKSVHGIVKE